MTQAIWNDIVIADSSTTEIVEGNHYFPADSVRWDLLQPDDRTSVCPWKGTASYYDIAADGKVKRSAAWQYQTPKPAAGNIKGHVAFSRGVSVVSGHGAESDRTSSSPGLLSRLFGGRR